MTLLEKDVAIPVAGTRALAGVLRIPEHSKGIVVFAHGSGSDRNSPRNIRVANFLNENGVATLLIDLLTSEEIVIDLENRKFRFDIGLLTDSLVSITQKVILWPETSTLPIGLYGASTGAAAALNAAARFDDNIIKAIVTRGGRVDLAKPSLERVTAPTLMLVGGNDKPIIPISRKALDMLKSADKRLIIVPGAGHMLDEEGAIAEVAKHSCSWFENHFQ